MQRVNWNLLLMTNQPQERPWKNELSLSQEWSLSWWRLTYMFIQAIFVNLLAFLRAIEHNRAANT